MSDATDPIDNALAMICAELHIAANDVTTMTIQRTAVHVSFRTADGSADFCTYERGQ